MVGSRAALIRETRPCWGVVKDQQSAQPAGGSQSVRSSEEAGNDRGAKGTQEGGSNTNGKSETDRRECRKAGPRRSRPGVNNRRGDDHPNGWCLGTRRRAAPLSQETHGLESRMRENPPVRFGGRGGGYPLSLPLSFAAGRQTGALGTWSPYPACPLVNYFVTPNLCTVREVNTWPGRSSVVGKSGWFGLSGKCWVSRQTPACFG